MKNTCESTKAHKSLGEFSAVLYEKGCFLIHVQQQKLYYAMIQQSRLVGIYIKMCSPWCLSDFVMPLLGIVLPWVFESVKNIDRVEVFNSTVVQQVGVRFAGTLSATSRKFSLILSNLICLIGKSHPLCASRGDGVGVVTALLLVEFIIAENERCQTPLLRVPQLCVAAGVQGVPWATGTRAA